MIDNYPNVRIVKSDQLSDLGVDVYELRYVHGSPKSIEGSVIYEEVDE